MSDMIDADATVIDVEDLENPRPRSVFRRYGFFTTLALAVLAAYAVWSWGFCRFYVGPKKMAIITSKIGSSLPPGQILAKPGQKGVLEEVLGEGRHIWNPLFYDWEIVDALEIPPGKIGVVTSSVGAPPPAGEFLAEPGQKGIWRSVLGPGRYRLNPKGYSVEILDAMSIPVGFAGFVTNQSGPAAGSGEAAEADAAPSATRFASANEKGARRDVLQPGLYYINPYVHKVIPVEVGVNQISLTGEEGGMVLTKNVSMDENNQLIQRLNQNLLEEQKRRREDYQAQNAMPAPSGRQQRSSIGDFADELMDDPGAPLRRMASSKLVAGRQHRASEAGTRPVMERDVPAGYNLNQFVNFPSRDGFDISLDMTVEFELRPENIAAIYIKYGDLPAVVEKALMPEILSVSRLKGSAYRAVDFIAGEGREKFQNDLTDTLKSSLGKEQLLIHSALIRNVNVPGQILEPLRVTSLSKETDLTNKEKQNTAKRQADLNREMGLIRQFGEQVAQETQKLKAQIKADMEKTVATVQAETLRQMAEVDKRTAVLGAERTVALGRADTEAKRMVSAEQAKGFGMKINAFSRDGGDYALYEFANNLNPDVKINIIHAGEGTLWTDLKNASMSEIGGARAIQKK